MTTWRRLRKNGEVNQIQFEKDFNTQTKMSADSWLSLTRPIPRQPDGDKKTDKTPLIKKWQGLNNHVKEDGFVEYYVP